MDINMNAVIKEAIEKVGESYVWRILYRHILSDVYSPSVYIPDGKWVWRTPHDSYSSGYQRRKTNGGLADEDKKYVEVTTGDNLNSLVLRVTTTADPSESVFGASWVPPLGGFLRLLEEGRLGFWSRTMESSYTRGVTDPFPRPVISNAQEDAENKKKIIKETIYLTINKETAKKRKRKRGSK